MNSIIHLAILTPTNIPEVATASGMNVSMLTMNYSRANEHEVDVFIVWTDSAYQLNEVSRQDRSAALFDLDGYVWAMMIQKLKDHLERAKI